MTFSRREFIERTGLAIAALVMARCTPVRDADSATAEPTGTAPQDRIRELWIQFGQLAEETRGSWDTDDLGQESMSQLVDDHRAALDALVVAGELDVKVADQVQSAYSAAAYHVWRSNVPVTCYEPVLVDFKPTSSGQLVQQADLLAKMVETNSLDRDTVARAQAAIERDVAFLALSYADAQALYEGLIKAAEGGHSIPAFDDVDLQIPPEAAEAARFLAELLLGAQGQ